MSKIRPFLTKSKQSGLGETVMPQQCKQRLHKESFMTGLFRLVSCRGCMHLMFGEPHRQVVAKPCDLTSAQLPTRSDVFGRLCKLNLEAMASCGTDMYHVPIKPTIKHVSDEVYLWLRVSLPVWRV